MAFSLARAAAIPSRGLSPSQTAPVRRAETFYGAAGGFAVVEVFVFR
jgi:hypothetical protein